MPRLAATRLEAKAIEELAPQGAVLSALGFEATRERVLRDELRDYDIVHFATHGLLDDERPELSGVVLSLVDERGRPRDGFLRLHDIYNLNLPARLVVLSACDTALGKPLPGEGLVGLVRGFLHAGARTVVASLWKVEDEATTELMTRFYRLMLRESMNRSAALRAAQNSLRQDGRYGPPFYWAAFELHGDWADSAAGRGNPRLKAPCSRAPSEATARPPPKKGGSSHWMKIETPAFMRGRLPIPATGLLKASPEGEGFQPSPTCDNDRRKARRRFRSGGGMA